jgi:hypothetical protein
VTAAREHEISTRHYYVHGFGAGVSVKCRCGWREKGFASVEDAREAGARHVLGPDDVEVMT